MDTDSLPSSNIDSSPWNPVAWLDKVASEPTPMNTQDSTQPNTQVIIDKSAEMALDTQAKLVGWRDTLERFKRDHPALWQNLRYNSWNDIEPWLKNYRYHVNFPQEKLTNQQTLAAAIMAWGRGRKRYGRRYKRSGGASFKSMVAAMRAANAPYRGTYKSRLRQYRAAAKAKFDTLPDAEKTFATYYNYMKKPDIDMSGPAPYANMSRAQKAENFLQGRGGYWGKLLGETIGGLSGNSTIKSLAGQAGDWLGDKASAWFGRGDYELKSNSVLGSDGEVIRFGPEGDSVRIKNREYIGPVMGSAPFNMQYVLTLNPGNMVTFPHLSKLAQFYQQYTFMGVVFMYKSTSGESTNSADTAIGEIIMSTNYNASEAPYENKVQMYAAEYTNSNKPSSSQAHGIECAPFSNGLETRYIRHGDPTEDKEDPKSYDYGKFQLAVQGTNPSVTQTGELWVTYDVILKKSRESEASEVECARYITTGSSSTATNLFPASISKIYDNLGFMLQGNTINWPDPVSDGTFMIKLRQTDVPGTITHNEWAYRIPPIVATANCTALVNGTENGYVNTLGGGTNTLQTNYLSSTYIVKITNGNASLTFDFGAQQWFG